MSMTYQEASKRIAELLKEAEDKVNEASSLAAHHGIPFSVPLQNNASSFVDDLWESSDEDDWLDSGCTIGY